MGKSWVGMPSVYAGYSSVASRSRPAGWLTDIEPGRSGRLTEDRPENPVRLTNVLGPPPAGDEREDLFGLLARHRGRLVGPHIRQLTQRDLERDRHPVQAIDGDRLLPALDLADELARQARAITQPLLAETALLAQSPHPLPQEFPHVLHRAFAHGPVPLAEPEPDAMGRLAADCTATYDACQRCRPRAAQEGEQADGGDERGADDSHAE